MDEVEKTVIGNFIDALAAEAVKRTGKPEELGEYKAEYRSQVDEHDTESMVYFADQIGMIVPAIIRRMAV